MAVSVWRGEWPSEPKHRYRDVQELRGACARARLDEPTVSSRTPRAAELAPVQCLFLRTQAAEARDVAARKAAAATTQPGASTAEVLPTAPHSRRLAKDLAEAPMLGGFPSAWHAPMAKRSGQTERQEMRNMLKDALDRLALKTEAPGGVQEPEEEALVAAVTREPLHAREPQRLQLARERQQAARALGGLSPGAASPRTQDALAGALGDPEHDVRLAAAVSLGHARPKDSTHHSAIAASLKDRSPPVHWAGPIHTPAGATVAPPQDSDWEVRQASARALGHAGAEGAARAAVVVANAQHDRSPAVQATARWALQAMGPAATAEHLSAAAESSTTPRTRRAAARALGCFGASASAHLEGKGAAALTATLRDSNREVREAALEALEGSRCPTNALVRERVRIEAASFAGADPVSVTPWSKSAQERFPPTSAAHLPPYSWSARIRRMRAHRVQREDEGS